MNRKQLAFLIILTTNCLSIIHSIHKINENTIATILKEIVPLIDEHTNHFNRLYECRNQKNSEEYKVLQKQNKKERDKRIHLIFLRDSLLSIQADTSSRILMRQAVDSTLNINHKLTNERIEQIRLNVKEELYDFIKTGNLKTYSRLIQDKIQNVENQIQNIVRIDTVL